MTDITQCPKHGKCQVLPLGENVWRFVHRERCHLCRADKAESDLTAALATIERVRKDLRVEPTDGKRRDSDIIAAWSKALGTVLNQVGEGEK